MIELLEMFNTNMRRKKIMVNFLSVFIIMFAAFLVGYSVGGYRYSNDSGVARADTFNELDSRLSSLEQDNQELREMNKKLLEDREIMKTEIEGLKEEFRSVRNSYQELQVEHNILKSEIEEKEKYEEYSYVVDRNVNNLTTDQIDLIEKYSGYGTNNEDTVDPHIVISVIHRESSFREKVTNGRAYGYGQLKLNTANYMAEVFDTGETLTEEDLLDGETNIKYTALFLNYLYDKYDGNYWRVMTHYSGSKSQDSLNVYIRGINRYIYQTRGISFGEVAR